MKDYFLGKDSASRGSPTVLADLVPEHRRRIHEASKTYTRSTRLLAVRTQTT